MSEQPDRIPRLLHSLRECAQIALQKYLADDRDGALEAVEDIIEEAQETRSLLEAGETDGSDPDC